MNKDEIGICLNCNKVYDYDFGPVNMADPGIPQCSSCGQDLVLLFKQDKELIERGKLNKLDNYRFHESELADICRLYFSS